MKPMTANAEQMNQSEKKGKKTSKKILTRHFWVCESFSVYFFATAAALSSYTYSDFVLTFIALCKKTVSFDCICFVIFLF